MSERMRWLPHYNYDDWCAWEGNWELIDGIPFAMSPAPSIEHQKISGLIHHQLVEALKQAQCESCQAFLPLNWKVSQHIVLQPDHLVVCGDVKGNVLTTKPALIFEVLSPATAGKDRTVKMDIYREQEIPYYIIVDPISLKAEVYQLSVGGYVLQLQATQQKKPQVFSFAIDRNCKFNLDFSSLFS